MTRKAAIAAPGTVVLSLALAMGASAGVGNSNAPSFSNPTIGEANGGQDLFQLKNTIRVQVQDRLGSVVVGVRLPVPPSTIQFVRVRLPVPPLTLPLPTVPF